MAAQQSEYFWQETLDTGVVRLGLTPQAQDELGRVKFVDLPSQAGTLTKGDTLLAVEAEKAVLDLPAPISGEIKKVHTAITDEPELMNSTNRKDNWIAEIIVTKS
ncbi:glycine cleavage system protein H [Agrilactobacillus yilanensis]|uniref:Glycine cleavage system protein H n=1 Tax=Agrilactobacillus yilanensis TaxID=2485997 RepID=A0ABW4J7T8_9LACO|nr:glycine cleavage system protein H [Agrilactobacillus yilanensis]